MFTGVNADKNSVDEGLNRKKLLNFIRGKSCIIIFFLLILLIILNMLFYNNQLVDVNLKDVSVVNKLSISSIILGVLVGMLSSLFIIVWYEQKIKEYKHNDSVKSYARIFRADIERSRRLFKNKRFELVKINSITIMKNWIQCFGYISSKLSIEEIQELVNYYSRIEKLVEYETRINQHLERMQGSKLNEYPYMEEYKELIAMFTYEINNLFKVEVQNLATKLNYLCK